MRGTGPADLAELERAWTEARTAWGATGAGMAGVPVGVGWLSYELGRRLVGLPARAVDEPLFEFHFHDAVWVRDGAGEPKIFARDTAAGQRLAGLLSRAVVTEAPRLGPLRAVDPEAAFLDGVRRILDYLRAGDAYQVNLSRRLRATSTAGDPTFLAAALRQRAPAPHAAFIANARRRGRGAHDLGQLARAVSLARRRRRRRDAADQGDAAARRRTPRPTARRPPSFSAAAKDRAEHVMIVDLERNDLGRVCRPGSVEVASLARVVSLPTVHHLISTVRGRLRPDVGLAALLAATFPGGSITGAPKRRAMQIIDELEPAPRGAYTGATGWLGAAGDLDLAIAIRTAVLRAGALELSVGGGIVVDSTPEAELAETEVKARAFAELCGATPEHRPPPAR